MYKLILLLVTAALAIGGAAYAGDGNDQGSGDQAWAQVNPNGGSPLLVRSKNFVSVSSPSTGIYCLHARPGVNLANSAPLATQEVDLSSSLGLVTVRRSGIPNANCPADDLQVNTWGGFDFSLVNTIGFDVLVP
jgi:hypothetical protein